MLKRTTDRKTANAATPNGKGAKVANAFSLPAGPDFSCPFATAFCFKICYAGRLEKQYVAFKNVVMHNWNLLKDADWVDMVALLDEMVNAFWIECEQKDLPKAFRIHADGDFFNQTYVEAWRHVISRYSDIQFWVYTRVPSAAITLHNAKLDNLGLYFSSDPDNYQLAQILAVAGINIAHVDTTFAEGKKKYAKATFCPEQKKSLPLISEKGGACFVCGLCVNGRKDVLFSSTKK